MRQRIYAIATVFPIALTLVLLAFSGAAQAEPCPSLSSGGC